MMKPRRGALVVAVVALAGLLGACAGDGADKNTDAQPTASTAERNPEGARNAVTIDTFRFEPDGLRVGVGTTVTWANQDSILHTVTSGTREYEPGNGGSIVATQKDGLFDMPLDGVGATASFTFSAAGTFHYFCDRHPGMEADVFVE